MTGAGEQEIVPFCYCESSPGHHTLFSYNNAALNQPVAAPSGYHGDGGRSPGDQTNAFRGSQVARPVPHSAYVIPEAFTASVDS